MPLPFLPYPLKVHTVFMLLGGWCVEHFLHASSDDQPRIVESTIRTTNNLLERLHASFFFYLLPESASFTKIGFYLPSVVLVSTAMLFGGLGAWVAAGWTEVLADKVGSSSKLKWERRARPAGHAISIMVFTHIAGACLSFLVISSIYVRHASVSHLCSKSLFLD
jgi:GPI-anchor transamidase subunit GAA1